MNWWNALVSGGGAAGVFGALRYILKSRKLRSVAAQVLDPDSDTSPLDDLRLILNEQRKGYEHLAGRVTILEHSISNLERKLAEARERERSLQRKLREERKLSGGRIEELERELADAKDRIAHLEEMLREAQGGA